MLSQFQTRHPTGSLISELLTISQGKFVVRVSAQVEGVTRSTGMAAAETLELAEDRARSRALAVLGIEPAVSVLQPSKSEVDYSERLFAEDASTPEQQIRINTTFSSEPSFKIGHELNNLDHLSSQVLPQDGGQQREILQEEGFSPPLPKYMQHLTFASEPTPAVVEELELIPEKQDESSRETPNSFDNVIPLPLNYSPPDTSWLEPNVVEVEKRTSVPVDLSDAIARTDIEMERLQWDKNQGREYLKQKYGKQSRPKLTDEELLEFLHYLKSQPSPQDNS